MDACKLCGYNAITTKDDPHYGYYPVTDCKNCGKFAWEDATITFPSDQITKAKLSHAIRKAQGEKPLEITYDFINGVARRELPTVVEQVDNLIVCLGKNSFAGKVYRVAPITHQAFVGSVDKVGFDYIVDYSIDDFRYLANSASFLPQDKILNNHRDLLLTPKGWQRFEELKRGTVQSRKAFMAMPFDNVELKKVFENHFVTAVRETGFSLERVDTSPQAGLIDDKIRADIRNSRFVIADLTDDNNGAYWEAGYAEGLGKQVIYTCKKSYFDKKGTHFDANHHLTIFWDENNLDEAAKKLKATIRATLPDEAKMQDDKNDL